MSVRTWLFENLDNPVPVIPEKLWKSVWAKKSMRSSREEHPYLIFKLGNDTDEGLSENIDVHRQYIQIYVHDYHDTEVGDYGKIDEIVKALKLLLSGRQSPADGIIRVQYLETSQDLDDQTLGTLMKYVRFVAITKG